MRKQLKIPLRGAAAGIEEVQGLGGVEQVRTSCPGEAAGSRGLRVFVSTKAAERPRGAAETKSRSRLVPPFPT